MKSVLCFAIGCAAILAEAQTPAAEAAPRIAIQPAALSPVATGAPENFTGTVHVGTPFQALAPGRAGGASVTFEAGARTAWHTHPLGQTLVVIGGTGLVQQQGEAARVIRPGDVVTIPPNVRHWHGAGPSGPMTHLAIAEKEDGISVTWQAKVSDAEYQTAIRSAGLASLDTGTAKNPGSTTIATSESEVLSAKQQAIPLIGSAMAASDMPKLRAALAQGLDAGLSVGEEKEILVQLYAYAGFPRSLNALAELMSVVEARQQRGLIDDPGREPARAVPVGDELVAIGRANQTRISGGPVKGAVFDFAPAINQFLQAHLFGDIFERDNLDWQSRELATVGALAGTPGAEAQLLSHMRASLRVGLTAGQLHELVAVLAAQGDAAHAARAKAALAQAIAAATKR